VRRFCIALALLLTTDSPAQVAERFVTGIQVVGAGESCSVFVGGVVRDSPAALAHVKTGDVLLAVYGTAVTTGEQAATLLRSNAPNPLRVKFLRGEQQVSVVVNREKLSEVLRKEGQKVLDDGIIIPLDGTEEEFRNKFKTLTNDRFAARAFPTHYPENTDLYYAGFEIIVLRNPTQVAVLGMEDGPASRAGVHWGDLISAVNGIDPRGKSVPELEALFSSNTPKEMILAVERNGLPQKFSFRLEKASDVLRENGQQIYNGKVIPFGIPQRYLPCFK
jgi:C-terminal processing protease CtpA/Prc